MHKTMAVVNAVADTTNTCSEFLWELVLLPFTVLEFDKEHARKASLRLGNVASGSKQAWRTVWTLSVLGASGVGGMLAYMRYDNHKFHDFDQHALWWSIGILSACALVIITVLLDSKKAPRFPPFFGTATFQPMLEGTSRDCTQWLTSQRTDDKQERDHAVILPTVAVAIYAGIFLIKWLMLASTSGDIASIFNDHPTEATRLIANTEKLRYFSYVYVMMVPFFTGLSFDHSIRREFEAGAAMQMRIAINAMAIRGFWMLLIVTMFDPSATFLWSQGHHKEGAQFAIMLTLLCVASAWTIRHWQSYESFANKTGMDLFSAHLDFPAQIAFTFAAVFSFTNRFSNPDLIAIPDQSIAGDFIFSIIYMTLTICSITHIRNRRYVTIFDIKLVDVVAKGAEDMLDKAETVVEQSKFLGEQGKFDKHADFASSTPFAVPKNRGYDNL